MASKNEMTIKQGFERALNDYKRIGDAQMVAFFEKRLAQENKRAIAERKLTPHQLENERIKEDILDNMQVDKLYSITDMFCEFNCFLFTSS